MPLSKDDQLHGEGLHVRGISKSFAKRKVVRGLNLSVARGQVVGLLGPNGAGKTTCFYAVVGLIKPDTGAIFMDGEDITKMPMYQRARMGISYLAQEASIFRGMTVEQNIMSVVELRQTNRKDAERVVSELLEELSISHLRKAAAPALSGGERRRVEIARALAGEPSFLLMDEPFAGLDPLAVADISKVIAHLKARQLGILITDHNVRETLDIVDRASIIYEGQVLFDGTPEQMLANQEVRRVYLGATFDQQPEDWEVDDNGKPKRAAVSMDSDALAAPRSRSPLALQLDEAEPKPRTRLSWKEFWELTNKPKNSPLVFGGGIFCGLVFGVFLGTVALHPNKPATKSASAVAAARSALARGKAYTDALAVVDVEALWKPYAINWQSTKAPFKVFGSAPQTIATPIVQYDYAAVSQALSTAVVSEEIVLRVDVSNVKGKVGLSLLNPAGSPLVSEEQAVTSDDGKRAVFFRVRPQDLPAELLVRNYADTSNVPGSITIQRVSYTAASQLSDAQMNALKKIGLNRPIKP